MSEEQVAPVVGAAAGDAKSTDTAVHETGAEASEGSAVLIEAAAHPAAEVSAQSADAPDTPVKTSADELLAEAAVRTPSAEGRATGEALIFASPGPIQPRAPARILAED